MATRDKTSGIGYSNTNVYVLYRKSQAAAPVSAAAAHSSSRVLRPDDLANARIERFEPRRIEAPSVPPAGLPEEELSARTKSLQELKANFARLQELHGRLRFMLQELEDLVRKKK